MHLALSSMHLTLLSANIIALSDDISKISFSPILATTFGSNPAKACLYYQSNVKIHDKVILKHVNFSFIW